MPAPDMEYVGFWARVLAALIDSVLIVLVIGPLLYWIYGPAFFQSLGVAGGLLDLLPKWVVPLIEWVFPVIAVLGSTTYAIFAVIAVILFWIYRQATPGKMVIGARIVDATTGMPPSKGQLIGRYLGYYVSMIPFFLGMLWVAFDARKQGWHDKLAGTVVIKDRR